MGFSCAQPVCFTGLVSLKLAAEWLTLVRGWGGELAGFDITVLGRVWGRLSGSPHSHTLTVSSCVLGFPGTC